MHDMKKLFRILRNFNLEHGLFYWATLLTHITEWGRWIVRFTLFFMIYYMIFSYLFYTPSERRLLRVNKDLTTTLNKVIEQKKLTDKVVASLRERDRNLYQLTFKIPLPEAKFDPNSYRLHVNAHSDDLLDAGKRLETIERKARIPDSLFTKLRNDKDGLLSRVANIPSIQPIINFDFKFTSTGYGMKVSPFYKVIKPHYGMDFVSSAGSEVYATANGVVDYTGNNMTNGIQVIIDHGNGYKTVYSHLDKATVKNGQNVRKRMLIGRVGNTGRSITPHLHYEVHWHDRPVNPVHFFFEDLDKDQYIMLLGMTDNKGQSLD